MGRLLQRLRRLTDRGCGELPGDGDGAGPGGAGTDSVEAAARGYFGGVTGLDGVVAEPARARSVGVEYMTFDIHELAVIGDAVLTRRTDRLHAADWSVLAEPDMMGYNRVVDGKIVFGKDHHFEVAAYDSTRGAGSDT